MSNTQQPIASAKPSGTAYVPQRNVLNKRIYNDYFPKGKYNPRFSAERAGDIKKRKLSTPSDRLEKSDSFMSILMAYTDTQ